MPGIDNKSETAVCNLALGHLGISEEINNLTTEKSAEASACRRYFSTAQGVALRDLKCTFATEFAPLALVEETPNEEWAYSYRYPSNCLFFRRILSGTRNDTSGTRVPYKLASDAVGKLVYTDKQNAECEFTKLVSDQMLWPDDFILAVSYLLAALIAPRLTRGDGVKLGDRALELYNLTKQTTEANADSEQQGEEPPEAESIRARE
jgi:hypothetical protein